MFVFESDAAQPSGQFGLLISCLKVSVAPPLLWCSAPLRALEGERTSFPCGAAWNDGNNGSVAASSAAGDTA